MKRTYEKPVLMKRQKLSNVVATATGSIGPAGLHLTVCLVWMRVFFATLVRRCGRPRVADLSSADGQRLYAALIALRQRERAHGRNRL
ncbi:hypothetical protein [Mesorhizobium sp.]|nr:hypothetical protein [Mesorhizobium sp.]RWA83788.1 MAG: hypothetical protein EOQ30_10645 [Mesorhizobium sp.]